MLLPQADRLQKSRARIAMERNPFLARRLARVIGTGANGPRLSAKVRSSTPPTQLGRAQMSSAAGLLR